MCNSLFTTLLLQDPPNSAPIALLPNEDENLLQLETLPDPYDMPMITRSSRSNANTTRHHVGNGTTTDPLPLTPTFVSSSSSSCGSSNDLSDNDHAPVPLLPAVPTVSSSAAKLPRRRRRKGEWTAGHHKRLLVQHSYHDRAGEAESPPSSSTTTTASNFTPFPALVHRMLSEPTVDPTIVSWQPHGRAFRVHDPTRFVSDVLPRFFKQRKYASFQRQLSLYGFLRLTRRDTPDFGAYYHEYFLRGLPQLASQHVVRSKVNGCGIRQGSSPETEPDFYGMVYVNETVDVEPNTITSAEVEQPPQDNDDDILMEQAFAQELLEADALEDDQLLKSLQEDDQMNMLADLLLGGPSTISSPVESL